MQVAQQRKRCGETVGSGADGGSRPRRVVEPAARADEQGQFFIAEAKEGGSQGRNQGRGVRRALDSPQQRTQLFDLLAAGIAPPAHDPVGYASVSQGFFIGFHRLVSPEQHSDITVAYCPASPHCSATTLDCLRNERGHGSRLSLA